MADDQAQSTQATQTSGFIVPDELRAQFPKVIDLIENSESMNDTERQYWIDILPVMNAEQVDQLTSILQNERDQLAAIDAKYGKQIEEISAQERPLEEIAEKRHQKASERSSKEGASEEQEGQTEEEILKKMQEL